MVAVVAAQRLGAEGGLPPFRFGAPARAGTSSTIATATEILGVSSDDRLRGCADGGGPGSVSGADSLPRRLVPGEPSIRD